MPYKLSTIRETTVRDPRPTIRGPLDVHRVMEARYADEIGANREMFYVLCLSTKNRVHRIELVSIGSLNASIVHPREILMEATGCRHCKRAPSASIILVHNHPTGDTLPSREDVEFTRRMEKACNTMGIQLLDHVIVGTANYLGAPENGYRSLKEQGVF